MIYVMDRHQEAIVHYLEALQHLMEGKKTNHVLSLGRYEDFFQDLTAFLTQLFFLFFKIF